MTGRPPLHERLLRHYVEQALLAQNPGRIRRGVAQRLDRGQWRIVAEFDAAADGRPIPDSLAYRVDVLCSDGTWAPLCTVPWRLLGLEVADVVFEVRSTLRQHQAGTYPGGPLDPHAA